MIIFIFREETEIIEGEVVEIQIDRPATGSVSCVNITCLSCDPVTFVSGCKDWETNFENYRNGDTI